MCTPVRALFGRRGEAICRQSVQRTIEKCDNVRKCDTFERVQVLQVVRDTGFEPVTPTVSRL